MNKVSATLQTLRMVDCMMHQLTLGGSFGSSRRIGTSCRLHYLVHFPYHHRQCHAMRIFPLFILNSRACTEVNNSFAGFLIVIAVDSYALHAPYIFLWKVRVEQRITNYFGGCVQNCWSSGYSLFRSLPDHGYVVVYNPYLHIETECVTVLLQLHNYNSSYNME